MKVFVTGAGGYVGSRVVERLIARGHAVTGLARTAASAERVRALQAEAVVADLADTDRLLSEAQKAEATLHLGFTHDGDFEQALKTDHALHAALTRGLAGSGKTLIVSNGTGGFGDTGADVADETTAVDMDFPLAARNHSEALVTKAAGVRGMAVRLPLLVYGHGGSVFLPLLLKSARERGVSGYIGDGQNRMSAVHVDDAAGLYVQALEKGRGGQVYIAADPQQPSFVELAHAVALNVGSGCRVQSLDPDEATAIWGPVWAFLLSLTNRVSGEKARRDLSWTPQSEPKLIDDLARGSYVR